MWYFAAREDRIGQPDHFYRQVCGSDVGHSVAGGHISVPFSVPVCRPVKASLASGSSKGSQTDPQLCRLQHFPSMCQTTYLFKSISDLYAFDLFCFKQAILDRPLFSQLIVSRFSYDVGTSCDNNFAPNSGVCMRIACQVVFSIVFLFPFLSHCQRAKFQ